MSSEKPLVEMAFKPGIVVLNIEIHGLEWVQAGKDRVVEPAQGTPDFHGVFVRVKKESGPPWVEHLRDFQDVEEARREATSLGRRFNVTVHDWTIRQEPEVAGPAVGREESGELARKLNTQVDDRTLLGHVRTREPSVEDVVRTERSFRAASVAMFGLDGSKGRGFLPRSGTLDFEAARDNYLASMAELRRAAANAQPNLGAKIEAVEQAFAEYEKVRKAERDRARAGQRTDQERGR